MPVNVGLTTTGIVYDASGFATMGAGDRIQAPVIGLTPSQGWVAFRVRFGTAGGTADFRLLTWGANTNDEILLDWTSGTGFWGGTKEVADAGARAQIADTFNIGDKSTLIISWTATTVNASLDGAAFVVASPQNNVPNIAGVGMLDFGSRGYNGTNIFSGDFFWVMTGSGTLSDANAATIHGNGDTDPSETGQPGSATLLWTAASDIARNLTASESTPAARSRFIYLRQNR